MVKNILVHAILIGQDIMSIKPIVEQSFPENSISVIEQGTVLLSDGKTFDCSIENYSDKYDKILYLVGSYKNNIIFFEEYLSNMINVFAKNNIFYNVDYEIENDKDFVTSNVRHPDFTREFTSFSS